MNLKSKIDEPFSVAGTVSNKILIFDIDDTLIYSNATIYVVKDGKRIKELTPAEYNEYVWQEGESFDYSNFDSSKLLNSANFTKYWDTLKNEYSIYIYVNHNLVSIFCLYLLPVKFLQNSFIILKSYLQTFIISSNSFN